MAMNMKAARTLLTDRLTSEGKSSHTIKAYVSDVDIYCVWHLNRYCPSFDAHEKSVYFSVVDEKGGPLAPDCGPAMVAFINDTRVEAAPATTQRRMASLRAMTKLLYYPNPFESYKGPTPRKGRPHPLPNGVIDLLDMIEATSSDQHKAILALCGMTGLRISEARSVRETDFSVIGSDVVVTVRGKGDKQRDVPVPKICLTIVSALFGRQDKSEPLITLSDRGCRTVVTRLGARAGVSRPTASHDLRMTYGTEIYKASKDLRVTQELLGHADSKTTERYTDVTESAMREAVKGVFG